MTDTKFLPILTALLEAEFLEESRLAEHVQADPALRGQTTSGSYDHWTLLDTLAHTSAWKLRCATRQLDWLAGLDLPPEDDLENANRSIYETCKNHSWNDLLRILAAAHERMLQVAQTAGEVRLRRPGASGAPFWTGVAVNGVWHPVYHLGGWLFEQGRRAQALELLTGFKQRLAPLPREARVHALASYDLAVLLLKDGSRQQAVDQLREAFSLSPALQDWARHDPDLAGLYPVPDAETDPGEA